MVDSKYFINDLFLTLFIELSQAGHLVKLKKYLDIYQL